jgi:hypothetical protein
MPVDLDAREPRAWGPGAQSNMPGRSETAEGVLAGPRGFLINGLVDPRVSFMDAGGFYVAPIRLPP